MNTAPPSPLPPAIPGPQSVCPRPPFPSHRPRHRDTRPLSPSVHSVMPPPDFPAQRPHAPISRGLGGGDRRATTVAPTPQRNSRCPKVVA